MPRITRLRDLLPDKLGSKLLLKVRNDPSDRHVPRTPIDPVFSRCFFIDSIHTRWMSMCVS